MISPSVIIFFCLLLAKDLDAWALRNKFDDLRSQQFFIDKTEFLRLLFDPTCTTSSEQFYFLTAPHRFSKSTLLRMIQSFCEIELDSDGNPRPWPDTAAYKIFHDTKIAQYEHLVQKHLARYPVIFLDMTKYAAMHQSHRKIALELNLKYLDALKPFSMRMNRIHQYILNGYPDNFTMSISSRRFIETLVARNLTIQTLDSSLLLMVKFMYELFDNTPVILLIDEYDNTALRSYIFQRGYTARNYRKFNRIMFKLIRGGKSYLKNIITMAVTSLAFASDDILPKFMTHMCFLNDHSFMPYLGVTQTELTAIFDKYECSEEERAAVLDYYQPYRTAIKRAAIYHPYSLNSYFTSRTLPDYQNALQPYWKKLEGQGLNAPFYRSHVFRRTVDDLLNNKTIRLKLRKQQPGEALDQLELLRDINFERITDDQVFMFIRLYFELGYLSHSVDDMHAFVIPNIDARMIIEYDREVYWARYAKLDPNGTTTTITPPSRDEFINTDPDVVAAPDSGVSLVEVEPSDPEFVQEPVDQGSPTEIGEDQGSPTEIGEDQGSPTEIGEEEQVTVLPEPEQLSTYDLRSRY